MLALLLSVVFVCACTDNPASPTQAPTAPPTVDLTGTWQGQYLEVGCHSTTCPVCSTSRGKTERGRDLQLMVTQNGAVVSGTWWEGTNPGLLGGTVGGSVSGATLALTGTLHALPAASGVAPPEAHARSLSYPLDRESWRLVDFSAQAARSAELTGMFFLVSYDTSGRETMRLRNEIVRLSRVP